ncbi:MAG: 50S ribosomal protein L10 [Bacteroidales bacterium]|nr:50S ribosomal protein L10 [Bacteroidales bacterium]MBN2632826.1 50S ribosomal protein L10 [Bacteroidales bacterium]
MRREEKTAIIESLSEKLREYTHFYLTDTADLNAADTSDLRRKCFENDIKLVVVKNTLLKRALEQSDIDFEELYPVLKGTTSIMFANTGNGPARLIKEFRGKHDKPVIKAAYVQESVYVGADLLETLVAIKTREELIGDIILMLQSPARNVISALQSGGNKLHGVLETLSQKE